ATALRAAGLTACPTHGWGASRESNPVDPESQSGPAPFGFRHQSIRQDSNLRSSGCGPDALATELLIVACSREESNLHRQLRRLTCSPLHHRSVSAAGFEPATSSMSGKCSAS